MYAPEKQKKVEEEWTASFSSSTLVFVSGAEWDSIYHSINLHTLHKAVFQYPNPQSNRTGFNELMFTLTIQLGGNCINHFFSQRSLTSLFLILPLMEKLPSLTRYMCMTGVPTLIKMPLRQKARLWSKAARLGILGKASSSGMRRKKLCRSCCNLESCEWRMAL